MWELSVPKKLRFENVEALRLLFCGPEIRCAFFCDYHSLAMFLRFLQQNLRLHFAI